MENYSVYQDIASRAGGEIYLGIVGPVRTGKSTFIRRFMETLVLPLADASLKAEMTDELPQAAAGKTVMTTEPKFVPAKGARIEIDKGAAATVRLVDCVGFAVEGANGFEEEGMPRLVKTPWREEAMPFEEAAELGTQKVIREHSTIGILVTTDGSIADIPRSNYVAAEERAVRELKALKKPFVILLNCRDPLTQTELLKELENKYEVPMVALNAENMREEEIKEVLKKALFEFPVTRIDVRMPKWMQSLSEEENGELLSAVKKASEGIVKMRDCVILEHLFEEESGLIDPEEIRMDLGTGRVEITVGATPTLFLKTVSARCGETIEDDLALLRYAGGLAETKRAYDKVKEAFAEAAKNGYGVVLPVAGEYTLEQPELVKKGAGYGVAFKTKAPSYHVIKVDVAGSVNPIIGTKEQSEEFLSELLKGQGEGDVWETKIFGKSLRSLMGEELALKNGGVPMELRKKLRRTLSRIVNDGKGNLICILF